MTYVLPVIIMVIYLKGYYDMFYSKGLNYFIPWMTVALLLTGAAGWIIFSKKKEKKVSEDAA